MRQVRVSKMLSVKEVAERLGVSMRTIHRLIAAGHLRSCTIGRSRRISEDDLQTFIALRRD